MRNKKKKQRHLPSCEGRERETDDRGEWWIFDEDPLMSIGRVIPACAVLVVRIERQQRLRFVRWRRVSGRRWRGFCGELVRGSNIRSEWQWQN